MTQSEVQALEQGRYDLAQLEILHDTKRVKSYKGQFDQKVMRKFTSTKALLKTHSCGYSTGIRLVFFICLVLFPNWGAC